MILTPKEYMNYENKYAGMQAVAVGQGGHQSNEVRTKQLPEVIDSQRKAIQALIHTMTQLEKQLSSIRSEEPVRGLNDGGEKAVDAPGKIVEIIAHHNTEIQDVQRRMDALMNSLHV